MASGSPQLQETLSEQQDDVPFPGLLLQEQAYGTTPNPYRGWTAGSTGLRESDPEDFLQLIINPDHLYSTGSRLGSPESDSGISEEPRAAESPPSSQASGTPPPPVYEVVCDPSSGTSHILSIQLGDWTPPMLIPDACIVSELLPGPSALAVGNLGAMPDAPSCCPSLLLTEEERQLLSQEGISLPSNLPLTKTEERILKKVRRKIRNKQSAQDSRRRKKEYIEGLESRVTACSAQNQLLQNKVSELEKHNGSLLSQLRRLRGLIAPTSNKAAQTSTCLLILIFSLGLLILPSYSPLRGGPRPDREGYKPIGVISRTILTKGGFLDPAEPPSTKEPDLSRQDPEPPQGHLLGAATVQEGADENPRLPQERGTNTSALPQPSDPQTEPQEGLIQGKRPRGNVDAAKPVHADEM